MSALGRVSASPVPGHQSSMLEEGNVKGELEGSEQTLSWATGTDYDFLTPNGRGLAPYPGARCSHQREVG